MNAATESPRQFATLDGLRGVAALLVILAHTWMLFGVRFQETYLAVDLFFLLSGVVIAQAYETRLKTVMSAGRFVWLRIVRIYPLYLLGVAIMLLALKLGVGERVSWVEPQSLGMMLICAVLVLPYLDIGSYLIAPLNPPGWSLIFELAANSAYALLVRWLSTRVLVAIVSLSAILLLALILLRHEHTVHVGWHTKTFIGGFVRVSYPFFAGVLLQRIHAARLRREGSAITLRSGGPLPWLLLAALVVIATASPGPALQPWYEWIAVVFVFPLMVFTAMQVEPGVRAARVFRTLGILSYAIYAIHYPLTFLLIGVWEHATGVKVETFAPFGGFALLAILLPLCWWLVPNFDEPARRWLLRTGEARLASSTPGTPLAEARD